MNEQMVVVGDATILMVRDRELVISSPSGTVQLRFASLSAATRFTACAVGLMHRIEDDEDARNAEGGFVPQVVA